MSSRGVTMALALVPLAAEARHKAAPPQPLAFDAVAPTEPQEKRPEHPIDIKSDHLTVLGKDRISVFKGNVHAVRVAEKGQPDLHILCDQATAHYRSDNTIKTIVCEGDVHVIQGDREGWGDHGEYESDAGTLVVTGSPHGQQGPNRFSGQRLTFFTAGDRVEVERAVVEGESSGQIDGKDGGAGSGRPEPTRDGGHR